jgi:tetratricopeptide (TPR) repeat protein
MAEQEEPVQRRVALKVIKLGMDTKTVIARFEAERQALALMDHPNIAKVLDAGATDSGRPYFVMELVRGVRITDYCDQNHLSTAQRLGLFVQICHAIQHAHQKGIVHRDIKPSNILVTVHDGMPIPKVIDFGIAKATSGQRLTDKTLYTAFEQFIGTPAYMSPEQAEMSSLDIDTRSDIYSLGVLLYELLTSKTPFDARELLDSGLDAMRRTIREKDPVRPSTRLHAMRDDELTTTAKCRRTEPPKLIHLLAGDLDWIVMKALEKDRTRRYDTANSLATDVLHHIENEPVLARPPSSLYRFQKLVRRNKLVFSAATAVAGALVLGLVASVWMFVRENHARHRAVSAEQQAKIEAAKSQQVALFLKDMLYGVGPSAALGRDTVMLREILEKTAERVDKELSNQPQVQAELQNTLGEVYDALGEYPRAGILFRKALETRKTLTGTASTNVAASLNNIAVVQYHQNKLAEAEATQREALEMVKKILGKEDETVADYMSNLANVLHDEKKLAEAETLHREALAMRRKLHGNESADVALSLNNLAGVLGDLSQYPEAEDKHREALRIRRKLFGNFHPEVSQSLNNLALVLRAEGKLDEAVASAAESVAIGKKLLPADHPEVVSSVSNLGHMLEEQGKPAEAEPLYREALASRIKNNGLEQADVAQGRQNLGRVLATQGKLPEAEMEFRQALAVRRKLFGNDNPSVAASLESLALTLAQQEKAAEGETLARECLALREKKAPDDWRTFHTRSVLGGCLSSQKKYAEAEPLLLAGYDGMSQREKAIPNTEKSRLKEAAQQLAHLYEASGQSAKAAEWTRKLAESGSTAR